MLCRTLDLLVATWKSWDNGLNMGSFFPATLFPDFRRLMLASYLSTAVFTLVAITHSSPQAERTVTCNKTRIIIVYMTSGHKDTVRHSMTGSQGNAIHQDRRQISFLPQSGLTKISVSLATEALTSFPTSLPSSGHLRSSLVSPLSSIRERKSSSIPISW